MPKFTLICEHDGPVGSTNTLEFEADYLPTVLEHFRQFLKGCSFEFDGELEIVDVDYSHKEPEPDYEDENEIDYVGDIGKKVFDNMAASLMASTHTDDTISITSLNLSEKCSTCGLPVTIMERNTCFDPKCGLK
jgi:hypothetical protein